MEPIPETVQAIEDLEGTVREHGLLDQLRGMGDRIRTVVPECVGVSLTVLEHGITFTLVAAGVDVRTLDAAQYVDGGPCLRAVDVSEILETRGDTLAEEDWQLFAQASAAHGIASTLSMPILKNGTATGGVNLYASTSDAFAGHHEEIAGMLGTWAEGAVTNADLSFTTLAAAKEAPAVLRDSSVVEQALGVLAAARGLRIEEARHRIRQAASQAGIPERQVAELVLDILSPPGR